MYIDFAQISNLQNQILDTLLKVHSHLMFKSVLSEI